MASKRKALDAAAAEARDQRKSAADAATAAANKKRSKRKKLRKRKREGRAAAAADGAADADADGDDSDADGAAGAGASAGANGAAADGTAAATAAESKPKAAPKPAAKPAAATAAAAAAAPKPAAAAAAAAAAKTPDQTAAEREARGAKHATEALSYLRLWKSARAQWKFHKNTQNHLLAIAYDTKLLGSSDFDVLMEYIAALKGALRQRVLDEAKRVADAYDERRTARKADAKAGDADAGVKPDAAADGDGDDETLKARYKRAKKVVKALSYFGAGMV